MANQAIAKIENKGALENLLSGEAFQKTLLTVLPKHLTPERVVKMALVAASRQPRLWECTKESILQSIMKSAELGLDCSGTLGRAYLVPYFNSKIGAYECQFIPGYQGLIELARRSGNIARIESRVVYEHDKFVVEYGLDQKLAHTPAMTSDRGAMKCVYAVAEMTDGSRQIELMTMAEIESIRLRSKAKDGGPWKTDYAEMARKTVIRRIAKYLPLSLELEKAFEADDRLFNQNSIASDMAEATAERANDLSGRLTALAENQHDAIEDEADRIENVEASETEQSEESSLEDLRAHAVDIYRGLKGEDRMKAEKFLETKAISQISLKKLEEFIAKFQ